MKNEYIKTFDNKIPYSSNNFRRIVDFYLFCCPVDGTSFRSIPFSKYGWSGAIQFAQLKKRLLQAASNSLKDNYYPCKKDDLEIKFQEIKKSKPVEEYCVFLKNEEGTVMQSLFSAIRNAFAHGSFSIREYKHNGDRVKMYFFSNFNKYLKAEIVLQESTLLEWIQIIKRGYIS